MKIRSVLLSGVAAALWSSPALAAELQADVVSVGDATITVLSNGKTVTYIVPPGVKVETPEQGTIALTQLTPGQRVTLTIGDATHARALGQASGKPTATSIRID